MLEKNLSVRKSVIRVPLRNLYRNKKKSRREIRLDGQVKKLRQQTKVLKKKKHCQDILGWKDQNKTADKSDNSTGIDESKYFGKRKET